ncbi:hypothetical protein EV424DRAFT_1356054 [Suillus variegatus]|nr:hypothetical protein EV424DRAFT_1356054 [Suillus variegatus]
MGRKKKNMSTSSRVTMSLVDSSFKIRTSTASLTQIRQERLLREARQRQETRELVAEAQLEAGPDFAEPMDFGDQTFDDDDTDYDNEVDPGGPLVSEFLKTCAQQRGPVIYRRHDIRSRTQRQQRAHAAWQEQLPALVDNYLAWKHSCLQEDHGGPAPHSIFHVTAVSISEYTPSIAIQQHMDEPANSSLLRIGLLGCSPLQPTVAIRLECLELYHQIRRYQSSFSIQAFTKVLCTLHNVTYFQQLRDQFSIAFDIYLNILRWTTRIGRCLVHVRAVHLSYYFIPHADVEHFKDDVHNRSAPQTTVSCTENWTAAKAVEENKVMVFDQMGIFLVACRHGFIECVTEMARSGELAKYGLAAVNKVLDVCGNDQAIGHDIACSSRKTIATSSIGPKAKELRLQLVVNAFHGFSHNRRCQLENHPLYLTGLGIEDLETCERIFASSNSTAPLIRHASHFHWVQFLDLHFDKWGTDKYLELSMNQPCKQYTVELEEFKQRKELADADFVKWRDEEFEYLGQVATEPTADAIAVAYVERLKKLKLAEAMYGSVTSVPFLSYTPTNFTHTSGLNAASRHHSKAFEGNYAAALRRYELQLNVVADFEHRHDIQQRWTPECPEYVMALKYFHEHRFVHAVEELEGLVVQRLFELSKANLAGTGYKMRKYISKAITRRSAAIRSALEKYNALAPIQHPPRPVLDYSEVIGYASLGEFSLLKYSRYDVLAKPWTVPENWEMAAKYFKVTRAHEEILRLNVEIRRLAHWINHDDSKILSAISSLVTNGSDPLLVAELKDVYAKHHRINNIHRQRLHKIYQLPRFTGEPPPQAAGEVGREDGSCLDDAPGDVDD